MKRLLALLSLLTSIGCSTDVLIPCDAEGITGKVCREYRYYNEEPEGFIEFEHLGDSVFIASSYTQNFDLVKTEVHRYENGLLTVISERFPSADTRVKTLHYNEMDSLSLIVYGANDSVMEISYENGKRYRETMIQNETVMHYAEYRYYQDDGILYRISEYDGNDSLIRYRNFDYFSSNESIYYRVAIYSSTFELLGRKRFSFSTKGLINSMEFRLPNGELAESKNYIYDATGNLIEERGMQFGNTSKSVYLYY